MNTSVDSVAVNVATTRLVRPIAKQNALIKYRVMILWRFILAMFGGYAIAMYGSIVIAQLFIEHRSSAAMSATLIAFALQAGAFIWVFMVNKTLKASLGIIIPALILFVLSKFLGN